ncbi:xylulose kinase isoform X1 [Drosophila nasuta]|uniref:xylulose kinase isoform X1 n=1 Tax=Drosophila nasuta TaxID=42062 RepID=UPI00295EDE07|nr:xylulose kinase isoform X1 [Drosophila nasuta]
MIPFSRKVLNKVLFKANLTTERQYCMCNSKFVPETNVEQNYLGFDLSTQKLKAILLGSDLSVVASAEVKFDSDLPEFRTTGGANAGPNKFEFFVQPVMWVKAMDIVLDRLVMQEVDLGTVVAISGSAQQHGSVYWSKHGIAALQNLDSNKFLHAQVDDSAFVVNRTPIWMDASTSKQCLEMETAIGGMSKMVELTGSKCYERFTGPQIRKIYQQRTHAYEDAKRISLVSSFLASLFLGKVAPIDYADGSGMNLLDIRKKTWSKACLNACAPDLEERLCEPVSGFTILGKVSDYFVQRFCFSENCQVVACTGDNPSALAGMIVDQNWLSVSLGTSDTLMMSLIEPPNLEQGHVLCHPTEIQQYMGLLCFRNGSLVREAMNKSETNGNWEKFNELLESTPRGNFGNMAIHFDEMEIIPKAKGTLRWNKDIDINSADAKKGVLKFSSPQIEIRALIEGQMLHHRAIAEDMGFLFGSESKILATGGASVNKSILQVIADVFNAPVYQQTESEAALVGAAYRAAYACYINANDTKDIKSYRDYILSLTPNLLKLVCEPNKDSESIYVPMLQRYRDMASILESQ